MTRVRLLAYGALLTAIAACTDAPTAVGTADATLDNRRGPRPVLSTVRWTRQAIVFFRARGGNPARNDVYMALAQYRAAREALKQTRRSHRPSLAGAVAGASVVVLKQFYPLDGAAIDAQLAAQRTELPPGVSAAEFALGEAIGQTVAQAVLAEAATDNVGLTPPPPTPVGPGFWVSSGAPVVRGNYGARPFFLRSGSEIRPGPPPAFGSPTFIAALAEVRQFSETRTPEQVALTAKWVPFSSVVFNGVATDLIEARHRGEVEAAAILAYANTAAFDAIIACFDTKFAYWYIRPTQADPGITLATGLPNHPSYPSAHSCQSGAYQAVLSVAFPADRRMIDSLANEASLSRVVGGLHYRFDGDDGLALGRKAGWLALLRRGIE
jgi:PAP2 superfamily